MIELDENDRETLLRIARESIAAALKGERAAWDAADLPASLQQRAGAFVTLKTRSGDLRGCIGSLEAVEPVCNAVAASAISAAFHDPRFSPLRPGELDALDLEISVMGPLEPVTDIEEIVVGRDGLIIRQGASAGLLLPQVASEYGWDRETFLDHTCRKAGLSSGCWRAQECRIEKFSAVVFGE